MYNRKISQLGFLCTYMCICSCLIYSLYIVHQLAFQNWCMCKFCLVPHVACLLYCQHNKHVYMHVHACTTSACMYMHVLRLIMGCRPVDYCSKQRGRTILTCHPGHNWLRRLGGEERGECTSTSSLPCNSLFIAI